MRVSQLLSHILPPLLAVLLGVVSTLATAQTKIALQDREGNPGRFNELETLFIQSRFDLLHLATCQEIRLAAQPRLDYRQLEITTASRADDILRLHVAPDVLRSNALVLYSGSEEKGWVEYTNCETDHLLPVLALMVTTSFEDATPVSLMKQRVLAQNSGLTSHEPNRLMARRDSDDVSSPFMDFTVSSKYPVFPNSQAINDAYTSLTNTMEYFLPGDDEYYMQLYLAFTGRFSQYIGSRESAPVMARRFNPELFYRFWSGSGSYIDIGVGHESNGQRIDTPEAFAFEMLDYKLAGEPEWFARDSLSRGWDYNTLTWQRTWHERLTTQVKLRHYLSHGLLQNAPEEYNTWEDDGYRNRPRHQYHGLTLNFQYNFRTSRCLLGSLPICFNKLLLTQETGYSQAFDNNTTTLELTSDFFGLPIQLWARTGYNSDLVDYYRYSHSWGLGIELLSH